MEPAFTVRQVAEQLKVHEQTIRRWARQGLGPPSVKVGAHGHYRFPRLEFEDWLRNERSRGETQC